ncbi:MAG TPA: decaprenyl-phosphate phosphoribosyltransferase [bacterium]|nr:decaprenyl-phosphate phosphoribosyltransferase [bacterium]HPS29141.1 decaprenyl-phosphate phosphoribosyltransferase [bacterium]
MGSFLKLIRPKQYVKNLLVFFPLFFALKINDLELLKSAMFAFTAFCFAASSIYIINDIRDVKNDAAHPVKKSRPIASGKIKIKTAIILSAIFMIISFTVSVLSSKNLALIIGIYLFINLLYSFGLKNVPLIDIFIVSSGFLMRLIAGTEYGGVNGILPSHWIIIMTFLLSLFLAFAKRRDDLVLAEKGIEVRKSIEGYSIEFINASMSVMSAVLIVSYLLYTLDPGVKGHFGTESLYMTTFFVILGIFRYMQLTLVFQKSGSPTDIVYKDRFLQLTILFWVLLFLIFAY